MQKISTKHIEFWPEKVVLGFADISEEYQADILSDQELAEYNDFTNKRRQAEFLTARHLFKQLLEDHYINSNEVMLLKEELGKPYAKYNDEIIHVSFSHSPNKVYCALSLSKSIGLDVEDVNRNVNPSVVKRILNNDEAYLAVEEEPIRLWTIKEAAVKCLGTGLRTNLDDLTIQKNEKNRFSVRFNNDKMFEICSFTETDHQIALAYQSKNI